MDVKSVVLKSGYLVKRSGLKRQWRNYWCSLDDTGQLSYSFDPNGPIKAAIDISQAKLVKREKEIKKGCCFVINCSMKKYIFSCEDENECTEWINSLNEAISVSIPQPKPKKGPLLRDASVSDDLDENHYYEAETNMPPVTECDAIYEEVKNNDDVFSQDSLYVQTKVINPRGKSLYSGDDPGYDKVNDYKRTGNDKDDEDPRYATTKDINTGQTNQYRLFNTRGDSLYASGDDGYDQVNNANDKNGDPNDIKNNKIEEISVVNPRGRSLYASNDPGYDTMEFSNDPNKRESSSTVQLDDTYVNVEVQAEPEPEHPVLLRKNSRSHSIKIKVQSTDGDGYNIVIQEGGKVLVGRESTVTLTGDNDLYTYVAVGNPKTNMFGHSSSEASSSFTSVSEISDTESVYIENSLLVIDMIMEFKSKPIPDLVSTEPNENSCFNELRQMSSEQTISDYAQPVRTGFGNNMESLRHYLSQQNMET